jgi:hypothetical protein
VAKFIPVRWSEATSTGKKGKFDQPSMLTEFRRVLGPDKQAARTLAIVDSYMGGPTSKALLEQVYVPLSEEYPNVRFRNYFIRETFGFKIPGTPKPILPEMQGLPKAAQRDRVTFVTEDVSMIVGDDVSMVFRVDAAEPIRVFDTTGKVVETFIPAPGQTTRQLLVELMNGTYAAKPPRPVPDPVGITGRVPPDTDDPKVPDPPKPQIQVIPVP